MIYKSILNKSKINLYKRIILMVFGIFFCLAILEISLRLGGFIFLSLQESRNKASTQIKADFRILCLGESTTALGGNYSYPSQLEEILNNSGIGIKFSVINKGVPAINTLYILKHLEENLNKYQPAIVLVMMGINDADIKDYERKFAQDDIPITTGTLLNKLRICRLIRIIYLNIYDKIKEIRLLKELKKSNPDPKKFKQTYCILQEPDELSPEQFYSNLDLFSLSFDENKLTETEALLERKEKILLGRTKNLEIFKKILELNHQDVPTYIKLGRIYIDRRKLIQAEELFKEAIELYPKEFRLYSALAECYEKMDKHKIADEYYAKADKLRYNWYVPMTIHNFKELKEILDKRGIKLVSIQYPFRSIESLKNVFEGETGIIFIDNEEIFKDAVRKEGYKEYFMNRFAGDFGHCTPKGNRLLAGNIAHALLKDYFGYPSLVRN